MEKIAVIMVADGHNRMTIRALETAYINQIPVKRLLVSDTKYEIMVKRINQPKPFNYNKCLNLGARKVDADYYAFCNNDLLFSSGWADDITELMKKHNADVASPACPVFHRQHLGMRLSGVEEGYKMGKHFSGWCFVMTKKAYNKIGKLDERFPFYCADNAVMNQIYQHELKHILCKGVVVRHFLSRTLRDQPQDVFEKLTKKSTQKFNRIHGTNILGFSDK